MLKREVVRTVLEGRRPPYVPWSMGFTKEAREKLQAHFACEDLEEPLGNHLVRLGSDIGFFDQLDAGRFRDVFGVVWDREIDKDIGNVEGCLIPEPTLAGYTFPDPLDPRFFADIPAKIARFPDRFRVFQIGFSLYERAWTMRGMANLAMDFIDHPDFVHDLLNRIADYNIAQVRHALTYDIDAVYFGDDWGQQRGLQMGPRLWRTFLCPVLQRMYGVVRAAGKFVMIHSCGDVDELFDDLVDIGVNCFNPFQPEVMDVWRLLPAYRGRLAFHGGLSTQRTLPFGTVDQVRDEVVRLLAAGRDGGYIFAPAHDVEGDVPLPNMLAAIQTVQQQTGCSHRTLAW
ncbi:MAG: uroporphyrinogen-III decarboxylase-like protein [Planctomycetes bacterium]|nr:uroporphyrinogen-III decarboxylase-like protein [Planctomycetota bacterium]